MTHERLKLVTLVYHIPVVAKNDQLALETVYENLCYCEPDEEHVVVPSSDELTVEALTSIPTHDLVYNDPRSEWTVAKWITHGNCADVIERHDKLIALAVSISINAHGGEEFPASISSAASILNTTLDSYSQEAKIIEDEVKRRVKA